MKKSTYIFIFLSLFAVNSSAKMIEFVEDAYLLPAPIEVTKIVNDIAEQKSFDENYEITSPKKSGMQINPWNKFISSGKNPNTNNIIFIINPEWFFQLNKDEQTFLITRAFIYAQIGGSSIPLKMAPWIFIIIAIFLITLITILLGRYHRLSRTKRWVRILIALAIMSALNLIIINKIQFKILGYLASNVNTNSNNLAIKKSGVTKEIAINALTKLDKVIKDNLEVDPFWKPFEKTFEQQIQALKN